MENQKTILERFRWRKKIKFRKKLLNNEPFDSEQSGFFCKKNLKKACLAIVLSGIFIVVLGIIVFIVLYQTAPYNLDDLFQAQSTIIMDREGNELYLVHGEENRKKVPMADLPDYLTTAIVAIEDDEFYNHMGIDVMAIGRATLYEFFKIGTPRGGSTLTQQLSRNLFLTAEHSYTRKIREIVSAIKIEQNYSKDQILASYLNSVPFGNNAYGVESAANIYFGKTTKDLTLAESAILAALPNAPSRFSPYGNHKYSSINTDLENLKNRQIEDEADLEVDEISRGLLGSLNNVNDEKQIYVRGRVDLILRRMSELGYITEEEKDQAWTESQQIEFNAYRANIKHPHFVMYVKQLLEETYGKDLVERGGLKVYTTIDPQLQEAAEEIVFERGEFNERNYNAKNAALVSLNVETGQILAMVGARDYFDAENDGNVNVALKYRLPGSSFKPFVYAGAFLNGYAPATVAFDVETDFGAGYKPKNYDGTFKGPVSFRRALGQSLNIPAVKAGYLAQISEVIKLVEKMGIKLTQDESWYGLSLALGAGEVRLLDLVSAYGVFARGGVYKPPVAILKIVDSEGNILEEWADSEGSLALDPQAAYLITDVLSDPSARGAGWNKYLQVGNHIVAAKTGTSNKKIKEQTVPSDAWTLGYSPEIATGVWTGNNDGSQLAYNAAGLSTAGPIWHDFMTVALAEKEVRKFEKPEGIRWVQISTLSGKLPSEHTPSDKIKSEVFASFNVPTEIDNSYVKVEVDSFTELLASDECPVEAREEKIFVNYHSLKPELANWENPVQTWIKQNGTGAGAPPTEYCQMTENSPRLNKPQIQITSPVNDGLISPPAVGVWANVESSNRVQKVEFLLNNEVVATDYQSPYKASVALPDNLASDAEFVLTAQVFDEYNNTASDQVSVQIGEDSNPPSMKILYPADNQILTAGSVVEIKVEAQDGESDIDYVSYKLNDALLARRLQFPYSFSLAVPPEEGEYLLETTAVDKAGNTQSATIKFEVKKNEEQASGQKFSLLTPKTGTTFKKAEVIPVKVAISAEELARLAQISILVKNQQGITTLQSFNVEEYQAGIYTTVLNSLPEGEHQLYLKGIYKSGDVAFSSRVKIEVLPAE